jgi:hypothetical protein
MAGPATDTGRRSGETFLQRCCDWVERSDLNGLDKDETGRIASDLNMTASDLYALAQQGPGSAALLERRLATLDLDREEVLQFEPAVFRDLQRVCSLCKSKRQCASDLARSPCTADWTSYCPNTGTLSALDAMPWASRREW